MQIETGKYYKSRDGRVVGPMVREGEHWRGDINGVTYWFNTNGNCGQLSGTLPDYLREFSKYQRDLIAPAYPETGTLAEIGAQVGDVVAWGDEQLTHMVHEVKDGGYRLSEIGDTSDYKFWWESSLQSGVWRIITRASDKPTSPVRTVTKTEIVSGTYGKVNVSGVGKVWVNDMHTSAELTAAIATLTEIRDAMEAV